MKIERDELLHSQSPTGILWPGDLAFEEDQPHKDAIRLACLLLYEAGASPGDIIALLVTNPTETLQVADVIEDDLDSALLHDRLAKEL